MEELIRRLYDALDRGDGEGMAACYTPDAVFSDPAFGTLSGKQVGDMWRMLSSRGGKVDVELVECHSDGEIGTARWIARYEFTATGNNVVNDVRSHYQFHDDLIAEQHDTFDLRHWAAQAMGTKGRILGFTPFLSKAIQGNARGQLEKFSRTG
jgi:ketosteroid isomerase-like protein